VYSYSNGFYSSGSARTVGNKNIGLIVFFSRRKKLKLDLHDISYLYYVYRSRKSLVTIIIGK